VNNKITIFFSTLLHLFLFLGILFSSEYFLKYNAFLFFIVQSIIILFSLKRHVVNFISLFSPSFVALAYILFNQIFGGYLAPRAYGFYKDYATIIESLDEITLIICTLLFINYLLFLLSFRQLKRLNKIKINVIKNRKYIISKLIIAFTIYLTTLLTGLTAPFQFGALIIIFLLFINHNFLWRYLVYIFVLTLSIWDYSHDKRNIFVVLFLILLIEALRTSKKFQINFNLIIKAVSVFSVFLVLIILASINRGYGGDSITENKNKIVAVADYINADIFKDAITDNLELNYAYGGMVNSLDLLYKGDLDFHYGLTLIKPVFLIIPRSFFTNKPYSFMHYYTQKVDPKGWSLGSSLPVILPIEFVANFHLFGLILFFLFYWFLDSLFIKFLFMISNEEKLNFFGFLGAFVATTNFILIRGSGLDLFVLYILFGLTSFYLYKLFININLNTK
jgi:hypothetical protein